jgi:hypothetical protein
MRKLILPLLLLGFSLAGTAFTQQGWRDNPTTEVVRPISQTSASSTVAAPAPKKVVGIEDPSPAIWESGRTDASYNTDDSSSSSSDDYSAYTGGE